MSTLNVLRYSALVFGVAYGFTHTQTLKAEGAKKQEQFDYNEKVKLINEAKAEYKKLNPPKVVATSTESANLDDPEFDFGKFILGSIDKLEA